MKRWIGLIFFVSLGMAPSTALHAAQSASGYVVGVDDVLVVSVLQPDKMETEVIVSPDGTITFPYIGNVDVQGLGLMDVQEKIQTGLSDYMKYPVVAVSLKESRSRMFYVYGEVKLPGAYPIQQNMSVLRAVSLAGGFTKTASTNNVKILRAHKDGSGNETLSADVSAVMEGKSQNDIKIEPGDVITVSQRFF
jgi:polysaccharide export outer membrane protein